MLRVDQVHVIRHKVLVEGLSRRRVAREMGVSRVTVRKYVETDDPHPVRRQMKPRSRPVLERVKPAIDAIIAEAAARSTRKQRLTGTMVHRLLVAQGYEVGLTTVRDYLRERRLAAKEVYVPLDYQPGDLAQVDFFEVTVDIGIERKKVWMFLLRWMHSGRDFAWLYKHCDQVSFLDGLVRAFEHFGVVPRRAAFDNLTPAVRKILVGSERELQPRFQALVSHYLFEPCFTRPGEGHDKGGVEARGRGVRLRHLWPIPQGETLDEISEALVAKLDDEAQSKRRRGDDRTAAERFEADRAAALLLPLVPFDPREVVLASASGTSLVRVKRADYSVPSTWARLDVTAYVSPHHVELRRRGDDEVVRHRRIKRGRQVQYRHFLRELRRKPQAVRQCIVPILDELGEPFGGAWRMLVDTRGPVDAARAFATILGAIVDHGEERVVEALRKAIARGGEISLGALAPPPPMALQELRVPAALAAIEVEAARATDFDHLLGEGGAL